MFGKTLMYIWDRKTEIAKINREIELRKLAHEQAHNFAMSNSDNQKLIVGKCPEYEASYKKHYDNACKALSI